MKASKSEREEALARLREMVKPGDTLHTVLRHVSRSGMSRGIDVYKIEGGEPIWLSRLAAKAAGFTFDEKRECLKVGGCGMDMGFHVVYELSHALSPDGYGCIGEGCPSNDHSNGDRDYTPHGGVGGCRIGSEPCTCHDPSAWTPTDSYPHGCSGCGCHRVTHWHKNGGYALKQRWL